MITKEKKTIALISNNCWTKYRFRSELIKKLCDSNYKVYIIANRDSFCSKIESLGARYIEVDFSSNSKNVISLARYFYSLFTIYKSYKFDLVIHFTIIPNIIGGLVSRVSRTTYISVITGLGHAFLSSKYLEKLSVFLYKVSLHSAEYIFFINQDDLNFFVKRKIIPLTKTKLVNVGIDTDYYTKYRTHPVASNRKNFIFIMISRLIKEKGVREYIEAASIVKKNYPNVQFHLLGDYYDSNPSAIDKSEIELAVKEKNIIYHGFHDDVRPYIANSDCVVLPSYREAKGRSIVEGALMGRVLIASDVPGCRDVCIDKYNGLLCLSKSAFDLSEKMIKAYTMSKEELLLMSTRGVEKMKKDFNQEKINKKYLESIELILSRD